MKRTLTFLLLALATHPVVRAELSPQAIKRSHNHIDQLLGLRRNPPPPPDNPANPFALPEVPKPVTTDTAPVPVETDNLKQIVSALRINGFVELSDVPHLVINGLPYKEGDLIAVKQPGGTTYLRLKKVSVKLYILELNGKEYQSSLSGR